MVAVVDQIVVADEPAFPQDAIDARLKYVADDGFHGTIGDRASADVIENSHWDPADAGNGCLVDGIGGLEVQAARDFGANDAGGVAGIDEHPVRPGAVEEDIVEDEGVAGDGGFELNSGSDSQALSGGRKGRESEKEACKSHARNLRLAASDGLDGMVICSSWIP